MIVASLVLFKHSTRCSGRSGKWPVARSTTSPNFWDGPWPPKGARRRTLPSQDCGQRIRCVRDGNEPGMRHAHLIGSHDGFRHLLRCPQHVGHPRHGDASTYELPSNLMTSMVCKDGSVKCVPCIYGTNATWPCHTPRNTAWRVVCRAYPSGGPNFEITSMETPVLENPPSWNSVCIVT